MNEPTIKGLFFARNHVLNKDNRVLIAYMLGSIRGMLAISGEVTGSYGKGNKYLMCMDMLKTSVDYINAGSASDLILAQYHIDSAITAYQKTEEIESQGPL